MPTRRTTLSITLTTLLTLLTVSGYLLRAQAPVVSHGKPLDSPECVKAPEAREERDGDEELCVSRKGEFCAYPLRMMAHHRVVNDHLGGVILVVYDPDSGVGQMYDRSVDGKELLFDPADPVKGIPTVRDRETKSTWSALSGECFSGPLKGKRLTRVPSIIMSWGRWKALHPDSYVLKENAALSTQYVERFTPTKSPVEVKTNTKASAPVRPDQLILGVSENSVARAYPLTALEKTKGVVTDTLGTQGIVIFVDPTARAAAAYRPEISRQPVRFTAQSRNGVRVFLDALTNSVWTIEGVAVEGPLKGAKLEPVSFARSRWYAWAAAYPKTDIWRPRRVASPTPFSVGLW
jgi:hypothetical protein